MKKRTAEGRPPKPNDEIRFVNTMPYATRLEARGVRRGVTKRSLGRNERRRKADRGLQSGRLTKPNGAYHLVYRSVSRKRLVGVAGEYRFQMVKEGMAGVRIPKRAGFRKTYIKGGRGSYWYPSILLKFKKQGLNR